MSLCCVLLIWLILSVIDFVLLLPVGLLPLVGLFGYTCTSGLVLLICCFLELLFTHLVVICDYCKGFTVSCVVVGWYLFCFMLWLF